MPVFPAEWTLTTTKWTFWHYNSDLFKFDGTLTHSEFGMLTYWWLTILGSSGINASSYIKLGTTDGRNNIAKNRRHRCFTSSCKLEERDSQLDREPSLCFAFIFSPTLPASFLKCKAIWTKSMIRGRTCRAPLHVIFCVIIWSSADTLPVYSVENLFEIDQELIEQRTPRFVAKCSTGCWCGQSWRIQVSLVELSR